MKLKAGRQADSPWQNIKKVVADAGARAMHEVGLVHQACANADAKLCADTFEKAAVLINTVQSGKSLQTFCAGVRECPSLSFRARCEAGNAGNFRLSLACQLCACDLRVGE